jgi:acyl dehydratase
MIQATLGSQDVAIGDMRPLPPRTFTAANLMAYGAATWDWHRIHYDLPYAQKLGFPNVFVDGQAYGSIFAQHAVKWFGPRSFITKMKVSYRTMVFAGQSIEGSGKIDDIRPGDDLVIVILSQVLLRGEDTVATCMTEVQLPR